MSLRRNWGSICLPRRMEPLGLLGLVRSRGRGGWGRETWTKTGPVAPGVGTRGPDRQTKGENVTLYYSECTTHQVPTPPHSRVGTPCRDPWLPLHPTLASSVRVETRGPHSWVQVPNRREMIHTLAPWSVPPPLGRWSHPPGTRLWTETSP